MQVVPVYVRRISMHCMHPFLMVALKCARARRAGKHRIVFLIRGAVYLVVASRTNEPVAHLSHQLQFVSSAAPRAAVHFYPSKSSQDSGVGVRFLFPLH